MVSADKQTVSDAAERATNRSFSPMNTMRMNEITRMRPFDLAGAAAAAVLLSGCTIHNVSSKRSAGRFHIQSVIQEAPCGVTASQRPHLRVHRHSSFGKRRILRKKGLLGAVVHLFAARPLRRKWLGRSTDRLPGEYLCAAGGRERSPRWRICIHQGVFDGSGKLPGCAIIG